jgi:DNA processing protein
MISSKFTTRELLILSCVKGLGIKRLKKLVTSGVSYSDLTSWHSKQWNLTLGKLNLHNSFHSVSEQKIKQIDDSLKFSDKTITYWDDDYPSILREIHQPPIVLFLKGNTELLKERMLAIVGTRNISAYGKFSTYQFSTKLSEAGFTIISGFARGVDSVAHKSVVQVKGYTVAVLGCGLDIIYPPENKILYEQILKEGLLISEFLLGTKPDAPNFPKRNRLIASLSEGTLVIEAGRKSGSLITAEMALDYGKEIFALPGQINSKQSDGTNFLIKDGAHLVQSADDICSVLLPQNILKPQLNLFDLPESQQLLLNILGSEPKHIDDISVEINRSTQELSSDILLMEMDNKISDVGGKNYIKNI